MLLRHAPFLLLLFVLSCGKRSGDPKENVTGNWLVLYPDAALESRREMAIYGQAQDSIVSIFGLKLLSFGPDGTFTDVDSLGKSTGQWTFTEDSLVKVKSGGSGFDPFIATYTQFYHDTLQLAQYLPIEDRKIKVVWHLKKVDDSDSASSLFKPAMNAWRKRPAAPETPVAIKQRLSAMLSYYGHYFALVSRESIYFIPGRTPLPFNYYQHAMGLRGITPQFRALFYDDAQTQQAYDYLQQAFEPLQARYPRSDNFVSEYAGFIGMLSRGVAK